MKKDNTGYLMVFGGIIIIGIMGIGKMWFGFEQSVPNFVIVIIGIVIMIIGMFLTNGGKK